MTAETIREQRAAAIRNAGAPIYTADTETGAILDELADYVRGTRGELDGKALDEIAAAWLAGARHAAGWLAPSDVQRAARLASAVFVDINR